MTPSNRLPIRSSRARGALAAILIAIVTVAVAYYDDLSAAHRTTASSAIAAATAPAFVPPAAPIVASTATVMVRGEIDGSRECRLEAGIDTVCVFQ